MEDKTTKVTQLTFEEIEDTVPTDQEGITSLTPSKSGPKSAFGELGFKDTIKKLHKEIRADYKKISQKINDDFEMAKKLQSQK